MTQTQENIEIVNLQKQIEAYLNLGHTSIIFEFLDAGNKKRLNLVTVNPRHQQSFLFHSVEGYDKVDALKHMLEYVQNFKDRKNSYTIQWSLKDQKELQTSYFRAKDIPEALDKLFYARDPNSITIFSIVMNPIS